MAVGSGPWCQGAPPACGGSALGSAHSPTHMHIFIACVSETGAPWRSLLPVLHVGLRVYQSTKGRAKPHMVRLKTPDFTAYEFGKGLAALAAADCARGQAVRWLLEAPRVVGDVPLNHALLAPPREAALLASFCWLNHKRAHGEATEERRLDQGTAIQDSKRG